MELGLLGKLRGSSANSAINLNKIKNKKIKTSHLQLIPNLETWLKLTKSQLVMVNKRTTTTFTMIVSKGNTESFKWNKKKTISIRRCQIVFKRHKHLKLL